MPEELELAVKLMHPEVRGHALQAISGFASPIAVDLDPTSFCDLSCPGCISGDLLGMGRFTADRLEELAAELVSCGVRAVVLIGGGEPLMHPATARVAELLSKAGVQVGLVTNGTLLANVLDQLAGRISWVRVSLDAATADTYQQVRPARGGRNKFNLVVKNIAAAAAIRAFKIGISYVVCHWKDERQAGNIDEIPAAAELAVHLGCDYLEFKAELEPSHSIRPAVESVRARVEEQVELARRVVEGTPVRILVSSSLAALMVGQILQPKDYHWCPATRLRTTISPSGVFVCAYHRGQQKFRIGDVQTTSFADVWRRMDRSIVDPAMHCDFHCARHESNLAILNGVGVAKNVTDAVDWFI